MARALNFRNIYILLVTFSYLMVTKINIKSKKRNDTVVRVSKWLNLEIESYISDKKIKLKFPTKRNFVDQAVLNFLEKNGVKLSK